tara:strand:- start:398 stop:679 length:282 start_codon:yes stop_codon:yes gene_type:complete
MTDFQKWYTKENPEKIPALDAMLGKLQQAFDAGAALQAGTLRDEFAGQAMQGILSGMDLSTMPSYEEFGPFCYILADAMLEARAVIKTPEGKE